IYGMYVVIAGFYGATAIVAVASWIAFGHNGEEVRADHFHAHGRVMHSAVCLWGYLGFFQLMLLWIGNIPADVAFYARRAVGQWWSVALVLVVGRFVVPFFLLLSRRLKRTPKSLAQVGVFMIAMHILDVAWLVIPSRTPSVFWSALAPLAAVIGLAG